MNRKRIIYIISCFVLAIGISVTVVYIIHISKIKSSGFRYSIAEVKDYYFKGKVIGKAIEYSFRGEPYEGHCTSQLCNDAKIGDRYYIKVFISDPTVFELMNVRPGNVRAPTEGWGKIPQ